MDASMGGMIGQAVQNVADRGRADYWHEQDQQWNEENQKREQGFQRELMQNGIQWRVQDAVKAGLHPLFALGAQIQAGSPTPVGSFGDGSFSQGQDISQAISRASPEAREALSVQLEVQKSLRDKYNAEADLAHSQAMRNYQDPSSGLLPNGGPGGGGNSSSGIVVPERNQFLPENQGAVNMVGAERKSARWMEPGVEAGLAPGVMELAIPGTAVKFAIPATDDIGETLSEMDNPISAAALLILNRKMYGPYWIRDFIREVVQDEPAHTLDSEPKPSSYTMHQFTEALEVVRQSLARDRMPPARKEFSGSGKPWWWKQDNARFRQRYNFR